MLTREQREELRQAVALYKPAPSAGVSLPAAVALWSLNNLAAWLGAALDSMDEMERQSVADMHLNGHRRMDLLRRKVAALQADVAASRERDVVRQLRAVAKELDDVRRRTNAERKALSAKIARMESGAICRCGCLMAGHEAAHLPVDHALADCSPGCWCRTPWNGQHGSGCSCREATPMTPEHFREVIEAVVLQEADGRYGE